VRRITRPGTISAQAMACGGRLTQKRSSPPGYANHHRKENTMSTKNIRQWMLITVALAGLAGCAGSPTQESTGEYFDDTAITTRVKSAFVSDKDVSAMNVSVETFKGTVQLSGFAKNAQEADKAESIARGVKGVKNVKNDIRIK
jgi:hypothetical protein